MSHIPNMNPLLHWGNKGLIRGFHFLDPLGVWVHSEHQQGKWGRAALHFAV